MGSILALRYRMAPSAAILLLATSCRHKPDPPNFHSCGVLWAAMGTHSTLPPPFSPKSSTDVIRDTKLAVVRIEIRSWNPKTYRTEMIGTGTGFVIDSRGFVLTNNHVAWGDVALTNRSYSVEMFDGTAVSDATLVGRDEQTDLAALDLHRFWPKSLRFADDDDVTEGVDVSAIGFAKPRTECRA